jgi:5-formyltetrahydrofolate cyclo-ligase
MESSLDLRKNVLKMRDGLTSLQREEKDMLVCQRFLELIRKIKSETIFLYVSFRSEVDTHGLIERLLAENRIVAVPLVSLQDRKMTAIRLVDPKTDLVPGYYGILEPRKDLVLERSINHRDIDIVVLPGSVFDECGGRLGYGGGFYDRFLANEISPSATRIALAYDFQVKKKIAQESHDQPVDYIITEKRVVVGHSELP